MKKNLLLAASLACLTSVQAFAYDFVSNGVYYNLVGENQVMVTSNPDLYQGSIYVPAAISVSDVFYTVVGIEDKAFKDNQGLKSVVISDGVKSIGTKAFSGCKALNSVTLPFDLTTLSYGLFDECSALSSITIPSNVTLIDSYAFFQCVALKSITIPAKVDSISSGVFVGCTGLKYITALGETPATICENTFDTSKKGKTLYVAYGTYYAYKNAEYWKEFSNIYESGKDIIDMYIEPNTITLGEGESYNLNLVITPAEAQGVTVVWSSSNPLVATVSENGVVSAKTSGQAVITVVTKEVAQRSATCTITVNQSENATVMAYTTIDGQPVQITTPEAFKDAEGNVIAVASNSYDDGLGLIIFEGKIASVGDYAFSESQTLKSVSVPEGVTTIGERSFQKCASLSSVTLPSSVTTLGTKAFQNCNALSSITVPSGVITLPYGIFNECIGLKNVSLAHGLEKIDDYAFYSCTALKTIDIPSTVTVIDEFAFRGCNALNTIMVGSTPAAITSTTFNDNKSKIALQVPYGCTPVYQAAAYWSDFTKFQEYGAVGVTAVTISEDYLSLVEGESAELTATIEPEELTTLVINWSSSNSKVATVDANGYVKAIAAGSAYIIATANDIHQTSDTCMVIVSRKPVPASGISLSQNSLTITEGETATLTATIAPADASNKKVDWQSSNTAVATVVDGVVTAVAPGSATITATTTDGTELSDACEVTVKAKEIKVEQIILSDTEISIEQGQFYTVTYTIVPENATNQFVSWKSNDITVAMVSDGTIAALSAGTATITASATDESGTFADCVVTVIASSISEITADGAAAEYYQLDGTRISQLQKGMNVVRKADGSVMKIYVK